MSAVGIRALKQNASAVVAAAVAGEVVTITDRGRRVARLAAIAASPLADLLESGRARPARRALAELGAASSEAPLTQALAEMRDAERY